MKKTYLRPVIDQVKTGEKIRKLRIESGFTVHDIQRVFGFEYPQAIYFWEKGRNIPTVDNLLVLSSLFNVELSELLVTRLVENQLDFEETKISA